MKVITLIGMPGAGKSTIGRLLAKELGYDFLDLDVLIKEKTGRSHDLIIAEDGEERFLKLEEELVLGLNFASFARGLVFSPGGSIVYSLPAMEKLKKETTVFYLELPLQAIRDRLGEGASARGIIGFKNKGLELVFEERTPLYQSFAHHTLNCQGFSEKRILEGIRWLLA